VSISVDKSGRVISAQAGINGTTNSAPCLLTRAKEAALKTRFNSDSKAPTKQVGSIIYNFTLSN
ncbi:MAG: energy transducer TonB, partial [Aureibaculum sp.]|nr:energy transducer TonB [Aureibaculum sp.]